MVSWSPETETTVPLSSVAVMNAVPALLRTTASSWTARPPGPPGGPPARVELAFLALLVAAPLEAMPPAVPSAAHSAATPTVRRDLGFFMLTLLIVVRDRG